MYAKSGFRRSLYSLVFVTNEGTALVETVSEQLAMPLRQAYLLDRLFSHGTYPSDRDGPYL